MWKDVVDQMIDTVANFTLLATIAKRWSALANDGPPKQTEPRYKYHRRGCLTCLYHIGL